MTIPISEVLGDRVRHSAVITTDDLTPDALVGITLDSSGPAGPVTVQVSAAEGTTLQLTASAAQEFADGIDSFPLIGEDGVKTIGSRPDGTRQCFSVVYPGPLRFVALRVTAMQPDSLPLRLTVLQ